MPVCQFIRAGEAFYRTRINVPSGALTVMVTVAVSLLPLPSVTV